MPVVEVAGRRYELSETLQSAQLAPLFEDAWTASRVWEASRFLSAHLVALARADAGPPAFDVAGGRSVLELGSGCGLVALVAASLGADVVATDQQEAVELLRRNLAANAASAAERSRLQVAEFVWGSAPALLPRASFDFLVVSDCINPIYGAQSWRDLASSIRALSHEASVTFLAHEARGDDEALADFLQFSGEFLTHERLVQQGKLSLWRLRRRQDGDS
ncbi:hypothetical protein BBJ28_00009766 [Nothophytophthora sp. Chile5]|nr:hypothetical protein BBJ28_00009766 [Nothophytophthora sp. Chile5]